MTGTAGGFAVHSHRISGMTRRHAHAAGDIWHCYYGHPEDPATAGGHGCGSGDCTWTAEPPEPPVYIPADMPAYQAATRRAAMSRLMSDEVRVRVTNPDHPGHPWTGRLVGLLDEPSMILELDGGQRKPLPQSFAIEEIRDDA